MVRAMRNADRAAVSAIEADSFTNPWSRDALAEQLAAPHTTAFVVERNGRVAGYVIAFSVLHEMNLLIVAVAAAHRRKGLGRALLAALLDQARAEGIAKIHLEVRKANHAARALYARWGFVEVGLRRDYYRNPKDDAVMLTLAIGAPRTG
jgi:ribosomal-protein-alanine acetyltransferase